MRGWTVNANRELSTELGERVALPPDQIGAKKGAYRVLAILTAVNIVSLFDRVQLAALAQPIKEEFHLSDTQLGMLTGMAFGLTYAVAALPLAWLSDRWNRSRLLTIALIFWSAMTGLAGLAQSFWHLFLTRVGVAAGEAAFTPTAHSLQLGRAH